MNMRTSWLKKLCLLVSLGSIWLVAPACGATDDVFETSEQLIKAEPSVGASDAGAPIPSCGPGTEFCNSQCGVCVLKGSECTIDSCPNAGDKLVRCGNTHCGDGTVCVANQCVPKAGCGAGTRLCKSSCGICILPNTKCSIDTCPDNGKKLKRCGSSWCGKGTSCEDGVCVAD
jgi:hypothetical protein